MEAVTSIVNFCLGYGSIALVVIFVGWLFVVVLNGFSKGAFDVRNSGPLTKAGLALILLGIAGVVIAVLGLLVAGILWLWHVLSSLLTPASLALYSVIFGIAPMSLSMLGIILAKLAGGTVDARGAENCTIKGVDLGNLVYTLFMSYWLMLFTSGLMILGLLVSVVWVVFR